MSERERVLKRIDQLLNELATRWSWIAEEELDMLRRRLYRIDQQARRQP